MLAPDHQRILELLDDVTRQNEGPLNCRQIAQRLGVRRRLPEWTGRAKARRLAEGIWLVKVSDDRFSAACRPGSGS